MPQFDQFSFFNQVFWLLIVFFNFYFLITYFFLPYLCVNLKFRKKKILANSKQLNQINFENISQSIILDTTFNSIITLFSNTVKHIFSIVFSNQVNLKFSMFNQTSKLENLLTSFIVKITAYPKHF